MILVFSLNIVPKYEGKRKVMQQGANNAKTPAKNDAVREIPNRKLVSIYLTIVLIVKVNLRLSGSFVVT